MWQDDELLEHAKRLIAESEDDLRARIVAQALRLSRRNEEHRAKLTAGGTSRSDEQIAAVANILEKHPQLVEPTVQFLEDQIREMLASTEAGESNGENHD